MKNLKKLILFFGTTALLTSCGSPEGYKAVDDFVDPIEYETPVAEVYHAPKRAEDAEVEVDVKRVIIHYYNTDGKNGTRQIYTWTNGSDSQLNPLVHDSEDTDPKQPYWHIDLDYTGAEAGYAGKTFLNFIVKYEGTWTGQSLDTLLDFTEFKPDANGVVEVWTAPGTAGSIDIYSTKEDTVKAKVTEAYFSGWKKIHAIADETPKAYRLYAFDKAYLASNEIVQRRTKDLRLIKWGAPSSANFDITFNFTAHVNIQYVLETEYNSHDKVQSIVVTSYELYDDPNFVKYYNYSGDDLGCTYASDKTTFKLWAPTAGAVILNVYDYGTPKKSGVRGKGVSDICESYFMTMQPGGVWEKTLLTPAGSDSLNGKYYTYTIYNSEGENEVCDPYAKACGVNGSRGMILDFSTTNPDGWDALPLRWDGVKGRDIKTPQELSIYEIHIRDLTDDETWDNNPDFDEETRGTFRAFYQSGTTYTGKNSANKNVTVSTGFDHIEELGVNAIQIMPVFDHDNGEMKYIYKRDADGNLTKEQKLIRPREYADYQPGGSKYGPGKEAGPDNELKLDFNWGYNPLNYNCVEGSYSSDPEDGAARVREFKELILAYANNDSKTRTIMDVVYNHVSSVANTNFTKIMPRYYFRFNKAADEYYDGSGCSNEVKTEAPMMTKFIVDSLVWWAKEYKIKGFRFDLMELISSHVLTKAREELYKIDPDIYMYGEGWSLGFNGPWNPPTETNGSEYSVLHYQLAESNKVHLGIFNDGGRNALRGGNDQDGYHGNHKPAWGFISQGSGDVGNKSTEVGQMMSGFNSRGDIDAAVQDARQTINYASCHDNYTAYDQLSFTLGSGSADDPSGAPTITDVMDASITCHVAVMMSNGVAFMLGGEELFRTKVEDHPELSRYDEDYVPMYGKNISHNSYKSSEYTNSFKWNRKILVEGYKDSCDNYAMTPLSQAIQLRKLIAAKGGFTTASNNTDWDNCNFAETGNSKMTVRFYLGGYVTFLSGRGDTSTHWKSGIPATPLNKVGPYCSTSGENVNLGKYSFATYAA